jgi:hypothetical protein
MLFYWLDRKAINMELFQLKLMLVPIGKVFLLSAVEISQALGNKSPRYGTARKRITVHKFKLSVPGTRLLLAYISTTEGIIIGPLETAVECGRYGRSLLRVLSHPLLKAHSAIGKNFQKGVSRMCDNYSAPLDNTTCCALHLTLLLHSKTY